MLGRGWGKTLDKDVGKKTTRKRIRKQEVK